LHWVFEAKKRFGLSVLNYMVTSNHVRLLVNADLETFQRAHRQWVEQALGVGRTLREDRWSEAVAVGRLGFLESVKPDLGSKALIVESNSSTERMHCGSKVRLTTAIYATKPSR
jgi:hypothetical protein